MLLLFGWLGPNILALPPSDQSSQTLFYLRSGGYSSFGSSTALENLFGAKVEPPVLLVFRYLFLLEKPCPGSGAS